MRPGTKGFCGSRLREAREARGLTAASFAELVGVSAQSISAYEQTRATPGPDRLSRISEILNLPLRYFTESGSFEDDSPIYWRSMAAATKTSRMRARRKYDWFRRIVGFLSKYVSIPELSIPPPINVQNPEEISDSTIEQVAARTREHFGIGGGAIDNLTWLLENNGVLIGFDSFGAATLDAFSQVCVDGHAYAILNGEHGTAVRFRFDLAHELGHMVLHRALDAKHVANSSRNALMETQAHRFAAEFLMPAAVFAKHFYAPTIDAVKLSKRVWKVSLQAIVQHASRLSLITEQQAQRLWKTLSAKGWRRTEPYDDMLEIERPELMKSAFSSILDAKAASRDDILTALPFSGKEIESLCGLEAGTLVPADVQESVFDIGSVKRQSRPSVERSGKSADVINLEPRRNSK